MITANANTTTTDHPSDRAIRFTRVVEAPIELVWSIWTELKHLEAWFGPAGYSVTTTRFAFREGGEWKFVMHAPDGSNNPNTIAFRKLDPPHRLAYDNRWDLPGQRLDFECLWTFAAEGKRTRIEIVLTYEDAEALKTAVEVYGVSNGGVTTMVRLEAYLALLTSGTAG